MPMSHESTPMTCRAVQRMQKAYKKDPTRRRLNFIFNANLRLAAQHSIDVHTIQGLITALKNEKKKRKRGKRLNLVREEDNGPQFFSLPRVFCALDYADRKEAKEQAKRERIKAKKIAVAAKKVHKAQEKADRAIKAAKRRQLAAEKKIQHAIDVQARKELWAAQKAEKEMQKSLQKSMVPRTKVNKPSSKRPTKQNKPLPEVEQPQVEITTSRGRRTKHTVQGSK
jgi:hypothetical protein